VERIRGYLPSALPDRHGFAVPWQAVMDETPRSHALSLTWVFVFLGVALRITRYALNEPLWGDEAFVAANFLDRGFLDLLRPLDYHQVCPLLFLWIELAAVRLFGFTESSLRLFPTLCSVASVFLFYHVSGRLLQGAPRLLAVAVFAVAFYPIRHGAEVKPYASDLLTALVLLALAVEWWRTPRTVGWLWALTAVTPIALALSHPAVFVTGGISLALAMSVWGVRRRTILGAFAAYNLAIAGTFAALYAFVIRGQAESAGAGTLAYWANAFPPRQSPVQFLVWLIQVHTSHMVSYPIGGERGASALTAICILVAVAALWRRGQRDVLAILIAPLGLALVAAFLRRYPYGGSARTMQYMAPAFCLLTGLGAAILIDRLPWLSSRRRALRIGLGAFVALAVVTIGREIAHPFKMIEDARARDFARRFWVDEARGAEVACVKRDLGTVFEPRHWELGRTAVYLCNQQIYSPRHHRKQPLRLDRVSSGRPLRCVLYNEEPLDHPAFRNWLSRMSADYDCRKVDRLVNVPKTAMHDLWFEDRYVVYEFVPRTGSRVAGSVDRQGARR
jgi:hypothetical protein